MKNRYTLALAVFFVSLLTGLLVMRSHDRPEPGGAAKTPVAEKVEQSAQGARRNRDAESLASRSGGEARELNLKTIENVGNLIENAPMAFSSVLRYGNGLDEINMAEINRVKEMTRSQVEELIATLKDVAPADQAGIFNWIVMALPQDLATSVLLAHLDMVDRQAKLGLAGPCLLNISSRWFAANTSGGEKFLDAVQAQRPELINHDFQVSLAGSVSYSDPELAFQLMDRFELGANASAVMSAMGNLMPPKIDQGYAAYRSWLGQFSGEERDQAIEWGMAGFSRPLRQLKDEEGVAFLERSELSEQELKVLSVKLREGGWPYDRTKMGRWLKAKLGE